MANIMTTYFCNWCPVLSGSAWALFNIYVELQCQISYFYAWSTNGALPIARWIDGFTLIEHHVPNVPNWTKKKQLDLILRGIYPDNPDYTTLNTTLTKAVQNFILRTKRFSYNETK
jgi:hypothetical protein